MGSDVPEVQALGAPPLHTLPDTDGEVIQIQYDDWTTSTMIRNVGERGFRLLWREVGPPRFEHRCDRGGKRGVIVCAPSLHDDHVITGTREKPTVRASILCPDCGTHGYITDGAWSLSV